MIKKNLFKPRLRFKIKVNHRGTISIAKNVIEKTPTIRKRKTKMEKRRIRKRFESLNNLSSTEEDSKKESNRDVLFRISFARIKKN